ncbi:MAG TPA: ComEC/Rec2 family competence protein [Aggregatilineales bacterium]|nr:ComEC/Rec2 family competence protein [Aggregatilineales bacterium]
MTLIYMAMGWIVGILLAARVPQTMSIWAAVTIGGLMAVLLTRRSPARRNLGLALLMMGLGIGRYRLSQTAITSDDIATYNDRGQFEIVGIIDDAPEVRDTTIHLRIDVQAIRPIASGGQQTELQPTHGTALVDADRSGIFRYGDKVTIWGQPVTPPVLDSFNYQDYLADRGIYSLVGCYPVTCPSVHVLLHDQGSPVWAAIFGIKEGARALIDRLLPEPESGLLTAMLLNTPTAMSADMRDAMSLTGTSHLIVVAGAKVAIVGGFLFLLFGKIRRKWLSALLPIAGLVAYAVFTGGTAATVRATIMAVMVILAERLGRRSDSLTALATSVLMITLVNPVDLFDLGLIVSSVATLGLILYLKPMTQAVEHGLEHLFARETARRVVEVVAEGVLLTVAVEITTWPIFAYVFGQFSRVSVLANVLVFPVQGVIVIGGLLAALGAAIWFPIGQAIAWLVGLPLAYSVAVIRGTAALPGAAEPIAISLPSILIYYGVLFGMTVLLSQPAERRHALIGLVTRTSTIPLLAAGIGVAVLLWFIVLSRPDGKLHVWFLSVGKGNAVLIQTPSGTHWLIDGGANPTQLSTAIGDRLPFFERNLDVLVITQHRPETITAIPPLLDRYTVRAALSNGQLVPTDPSRMLGASLNAMNTPLITARTGYRVTSSDGVAMQVVSPAEIPEAKVKTSGTTRPPEVPMPVDAPLVLRLTFGGASFLLTSELSEGDISTILASGQDLRSTVLELPSNGSDKPNSPAWLKAVAPQVAVAMAEQGNRNAQPDDSVLAALDTTPLYRTDMHGTIEFATDGSQLWIYSAKQQ